MRTVVTRSATRRARTTSSSREPAEWVLAGRAWLRERLQPIEIGVGVDGLIVAVGRSVPAPKRHDVGDAVILPSATDLHVHFRDPGSPNEVENFETGTLQAALGGVGLVADMPNTRPLVDAPDLAAEKASRARGRLAVDVALFGAAQSPRSVERLAKAPELSAFKLYLSPTTEVEEYPNLSALRPLLDAVNDSGLPLTVHAEDPSDFDSPELARTAEEWSFRRPIQAENRAIDRLLPAPGALRLNVAHVTAPEPARRLMEAGQAFEASPHHLLLSTARGEDSRFKVNPPLRSEKERAGLWEMFCRGQIPFLASDHAPHSPESKAGPFGKAKSGMPGVETLLPLLLARVRTAELPLATLIAAACDRPARWLGVDHGRIATGHAADLVVIDFRERRKIQARALHAPCGWSAFEGFEGIFAREHYRVGELIVEDGEYVGRPTGKIATPEFARAAPRSSPLRSVSV